MGPISANTPWASLTTLKEMKMTTWIQVLQALLTPTIGIIAAYVAWQQYRLAKQKHDIDIFNRRMQVYKTTIAFLVKCERTHSISEEDFYAWLMDAADAEFLFGQEIVDFISDIEATAADVVQYYRDNPPEPIDDDYEIVTFTPEYSSSFGHFISFRGRASELFAPYFQTFLKLKTLQGKSKYKEILQEEQKALEKARLEQPVFSSDADDIPF